MPTEKWGRPENEYDNKNSDSLKYGDKLKNEDDFKIDDDLKKENVIFKTIPSPSLYDPSRHCF